MKFINMIMKNKYSLIILIIYLLIFSILLVISLHFNMNNIIDGGDTDAYLDPFIPLKKGLFIWEDSSFGRINLAVYIQIFYALPLIILNLFVSSTIAQFIYWVLLFAMIPISCYILSFYFTKNYFISFFVGLLYSMNLFTAIIHHTPVYHLLFYHGVTPLLIYLSFKIYENNKILDSYVILFSLLFLPLLRVINMYALYILFLPFIAFITLKYYKKTNLNIKFFIKKFIIVTAIIGIISSPHIIAYYSSYSNQLTESDPNIDFSKTSVDVSKTHATLLNIIRFSTTYGWENEEFWREISGVQGFNAAEIYHTNPLLILLTFFPFLLALSLIVITFKKLTRNNKNYFILLIFLLLLFIFLAKMINSPFGDINRFFYDSFNIFLLLFRSAWKYMQVPILVLLSIFISIGLKEISLKFIKNNKKFVSLIILLLFLNMAYILPAVSVNSNLINETFIVKIPDEYSEVADFLNDQKDEFRILPLPLSKHFTGYVPYKWGYAGPDVLYNLLNKPLIDKFHNPVLSSNQLELISEIEQQSHKDLYLLLEYAKRLNVKYILIRNDVDENHPYIKLWSNPEILNQSIQSIESIKQTYYFGNLTLIEIEHYPKIYSIDKIIQLKNVSHINIKNNKSITLSYDEKFNRIESFSFNLSFYLTNKSNEDTQNWKQINHGIVFSNLFKISISPSGTIWLFLYTINGGFRDYKLQLTRNDVLEKKIDLNIKMNDNQVYLQKDGFLYKYSFNSSLYNNLTFIKIGGDVDSEKMVGKIYNYSLSINNESVSTMNDLLEKNLDDIVFNDYKNISGASNISNFLSPSGLSALEDISGDWFSLNSIQYNPTYYYVNCNTSSPLFLCFAESYDPNWELILFKEGNYIKTIKSTCIFSTINGFFVNETGNLNFSIKYKQQQLFNIGVIASMLTLFICFIYVLLDYTNHIITVKNLVKKFRNMILGK